MNEFVAHTSTGARPSHASLVQSLRVAVPSARPNAVRTWSSDPAGESSGPRVLLGAVPRRSAAAVAPAASPAGQPGAAHPAEAHAFEAHAFEVHPIAAHPIATHPSGSACVASAHLTNRAELARRLDVRGPASATDAALVLAAYLRWGEACVDHLAGAFAFAVWDAPRRRLVAARDVFGRRPLFVTRSAGGDVALATDVQAIRWSAAPNAPVNPDRVADFLRGDHDDRTATFFAGIDRVPPGHLLVAAGPDVTLRRVAALEPTPGAVPSTDATPEADAAVEAAYRRHFRRAVDAALPASGPAGCWLSGGLDSSSVACVARTRTDRPLHTFSLTFEGVARADEQAFVDAVHAERTFVDHRVNGLDAHLLDGLDALLDTVGEPFVTPNLFLNAHLIDAAADAGVGVVLDGFLGDNVSGHGSRRLAELAATGRWATLGREVRAVARHLGAPPGIHAALLRRHVADPLLLDPLRRLRSRWTHRTDGEDRVETLLTDALRLHRPKPPAPLAIEWRERDHHRRDLTSGTLSLALETAYRCGAARGVELRFPFADPALAGFCLALPAHQKCRDGWTRSLPRRALANVLPDAVATRYGKANLLPVFRRALLTLDRPRLDALLHDDLDAAAAFVRPDAVRALARRARTGDASPAALLTLWNVVLLARWLARTAPPRSGDADAFPVPHRAAPTASLADA